MANNARPRPEKNDLLRLSPQEEQYLVNQESFWKIQELTSQVNTHKEVINSQRELISALKDDKRRLEEENLKIKARDYFLNKPKLAN